MRWIIFSNIWIVGNCVYLHYAAQNTFGQVSPMIPLVLAAVSLTMSIISSILLKRLWCKANLRLGLISSILLWAAAFCYNSWSFLQILYVS